VILDLSKDLGTLISKVETVNNESYQHVKNMYDDIEDMRKVEKVSDVSRDVLKTISKAYLDEDKTELETILSDAVSKIFRDKYIVKFEISETSKRADITLIKGDMSPVPTKSGNGAGVIEFISLVLRIFYISNKGLLPLLILDEHLAKIADEYVPDVSEFINTLCKDHGLDVFLVTHNKNFANHANLHYEVIKDPRGDSSALKRVK